MMSCPHCGRGDVYGDDTPTLAELAGMLPTPSPNTEAMRGDVASVLGRYLAMAETNVAAMHRGTAPPSWLRVRDVLKQIIAEVAALSTFPATMGDAAAMREAAAKVADDREARWAKSKQGDPVASTAAEMEAGIIARHIRALPLPATMNGGEAEKLAEALEKCRDQFAFYAREHAAAGKTEKAATNERFAEIARDALAAHRGEGK